MLAIFAILQLLVVAFGQDCSSVICPSEPECFEGQTIRRLPPSSTTNPCCETYLCWSDKYEFLGCYEDLGTSRVFGTRLDIMNVQDCYKEAVSSKSEYFGLQHMRNVGARCYVDLVSDYDSYGRSPECVQYNGWFYGAQGVNAVYSVKGSSGGLGCSDVECPQPPDCGSTSVFVIPKQMDECCDSYICGGGSLNGTTTASGGCGECNLLMWGTEAEARVHELGSYNILESQGSRSFRRVFRSATPPVPIPLNSCCAEYRGLSTSEGDIILYALLLLWVLFAAAGLYFRITHRRHGVNRPRSMVLDIAHVLFMGAAFVVVVVLHGAGQSAPCSLQLVLLYVLLPGTLTVLILKSVRLIYLHRWNYAKYSLKFANCEFYRARQQLISPLAVGGILIGVCAILGTVVLILATVYADTFSESILSSARCEWWEITPDDRQALWDAGMAEVFGQPVDYVVVGGGTGNGGDSLVYVYSMHSNSCSSCLSSHGAVSLWGALVFWLLFAAAVSGSAFSFKCRDTFGLYIESSFLNVFSCVAVAVAAVVVSGQDVVRSSAPSSLTVGFMFAGAVLSTFTSLYFPTLISAYYAGLLDRLPSLQQLWKKTNVAPYRRLGAKDQGCVTLDDVLTHKEAMRAYRVFALSDFCSEDIQFVAAARQLSAMDKANLPHEAQGTYRTFVRPGAAMQVQLSSPMRESLERALATPDETGLTLKKALERACEEVEERIQGDAWPRFEYSPQYEIAASYVRRRDDGDDDFTLSVPVP
eukprot:Rmarinus@m.13809